MSTSRRAFLRGAAALPAAVVTGGSSAAAAGATQAAMAGAGLATALSAAERKARAALALVRHGGFPSGFIWNVLDGKLGANDIEPVKASIDRMLGGGALVRSVKDEGYGTDKITYKREAGIFYSLRDLPRDVPLRDIISTEMFREAISEGHANPYLDEISENMAESDIQNFLEAIGPYCDEDTTAADLERQGLVYFEKLARNFLENPKDFAEEYYQGSAVANGLRGILTKGTGIREENAPINDILEKLEEKNFRYQKAHELMARRCYLRNEKRDAPKRERERREKLQQKRDEGIALDTDKQHRKATPSARERYDVMILRGEKGEYLLDQRLIGRILKMDWLQFVQEIDPENAKASDVEQRAGGLMVAFHNAKAIEFVESPEHRRSNGKIRLSLPNRRMGTDLNDQPDFDI